MQTRSLFIGDFLQKILTDFIFKKTKNLNKK